MPLTAYVQAEETYLELLRLFPKTPRKKSGKQRLVRNQTDFFRTIGQTAGQFNGAQLMSLPSHADVVEQGRQTITYLYQLHVFSDNEEDIFIASIINTTTGEFTFLFNPAGEESGPRWFQHALSHILLERTPPTKFLPP